MIIKQGTEDGLIKRYSSSWPPGSSSAATDTNYLIWGCNKDATYYYIYRSYLRFNTSSIPAGATITSAKLWLKVNSKGNTNNFNVQLQLYRDNGDWGTLDTGDWGCGDTQVATKNYADLPDVGQWFSLDIPIDQINRSGITAFEIRGDHESGTAPTGWNVGAAYTAETSGSEPYLEITLSTGAMLLMFLG